MRARSLTLCGLTAAALFGCAGSQTASASTAAALDGRALLQRTCTVCHDLRGLVAYADYWGEPEWQSMVETMIDYGAELEPDEIPVLVRYLAVNYGTADNQP